MRQERGRRRVTNRINKIKHSSTPNAPPKPSGGNLKTYFSGGGRMAVTMSSFQAPPPHFLSTWKWNSQCKKAQETSKTFSTQQGDETPSSCPLMVLTNCPNTYWLRTRVLFCSGAGGSGLGGKLSCEAPCRPPCCQVQLRGWAPPQDGESARAGVVGAQVSSPGRWPCPQSVHPNSGLSEGSLRRLPTSHPGAPGIATEKRGRGALPGPGDRA